MIKLPSPTGHFGVGTTTYHAIDSSRAPNSRKKLGSRELMVQVWYPTAMKESIPQYPYMPYVLPFLKSGLSEASSVPLEDLSYIDQIKTYAKPSAPISTHQEQYPIVVFSHGMGESRGLYTSLLEDLASHGYIVVALDHTYACRATIFPDERIICNTDIAQINLPQDYLKKSEREQFEFMLSAIEEEMPTWVADIRFILDFFEHLNSYDPQGRFADKLDLEHIGICGHSFGGAAAVQVCRLDSRCKAGINIDGSLFGENKTQGFNKPFLFLGSKFLEDNYNPTDQELAHMGMSRELYSVMVPVWKSELYTLINNMSHETFLVILKDSDHMSFCDWNLLYPRAKPNTIAPLRGIAITRLLLVQFFNQYLKNKEPMPWSSYKDRYPEIMLVVNTE